jgi:hypothetical protein
LHISRDVRRGGYFIEGKELTAGDHDYFTIAIKRWEKKDLYYYNTAAVIDAPRY